MGSECRALVSVLQGSYRKGLGFFLLSVSGLGFRVSGLSSGFSV